MHSMLLRVPKIPDSQMFKQRMEEQTRRRADSSQPLTEHASFPSQSDFTMNESTPLIGGRLAPLECAAAEHDDEIVRTRWTQAKFRPLWLMGFSSALMVVALMVVLNFTKLPELPVEGAAWSSKAAPLSTVNPADLGLNYAYRPSMYMPGASFVELITNRTIPLPTNSWYENFVIGQDNTVPETAVFQVPYILDTSGHLTGIRTHPCHVQGNAKTVMMTYELANGVSMGAVEKMSPQHIIHSLGSPAISKLAIELEWRGNHGTSMRAPIVRGSPYTSMLYFNSTPRFYIERFLKAPIIVDQGGNTLQCGNGKLGKFSAPVHVQKELKVEFDTSDMTWLIFFSEPVEVVCSEYNAAQDIADMHLAPGVVVNLQSYFELKVVHPMKRGMVRLAMSNNCTSGQNPQYCDKQMKPRDQTPYENLLRNHAEAYPTASADIQFTFPVQSADEEELRLIFNWKPKMMSSVASGGDSVRSDTPEPLPTVELLMFALPHHQERMRRTVQSSNMVQTAGCMPTIHGIACPAIGGSWSMVEHLHRTSFHSSTVPRDEMLPDLLAAAKKDLLFRLPDNYMRGAGDTYFSGKLLARMARIVLIADELGLSQTADFADAVHHLRAGVEIWLNGSAESPFLYDRAWGGLVMCGCNYGWFPEEKIGRCINRYPDCPALTDMGQNYGAGFYNDHHYHYGYHIYAAAVVSKFDMVWGKKWHQHVMLLVRDIANPSDDDEYFPTWRHKDWYLGFSWASGIVTHLDRPYPNGRNQESVSEAIAAYEAVGLYGDVMQAGFFGSDHQEDRVLYDSALRTRDMGRLLMATEIRSAKTYWHVQSPGAPGVTRIYPDVYGAKVVGMMWSMLAQEQTWFGNEPWKCYGIQLLPITVVSEMRDDPAWVSEMLPAYNESCVSDPVCMKEGWSVVIYTSMATIGQWQEAWQAVNELEPAVFDSAGANGHSLTNTLWYIATRPEVSV